MQRVKRNFQTANNGVFPSLAIFAGQLKRNQLYSRHSVVDAKIPSLKRAHTYTKTCTYHQNGCRLRGSIFKARIHTHTYACTFTHTHIRQNGWNYEVLSSKHTYTCTHTCAHTHRQNGWKPRDSILQPHMTRHMHMQCIPPKLT